MKTPRRILFTLLGLAPLAGGCRLGSGQAMPMAANQSPTAPSSQLGQPDVRTPTERDPALHVSNAGASMANGAAAQLPAEPGDEDAKMAAEMQALGTQMKEMAAKMQKHSSPMKGKGMAGKAPPSGATDTMDPAMAMAMGGHLKEMGAQMQHKARKMRSDGMAAKATQSAGGAMGTAAPAKMMGMGDQMMGMGDQMMGREMGAMDPAKMMEMGRGMMEMGSEMGGMSSGMGRKNSAPLKNPMGTPPPSDAPDQTPMPHM